MAKQYTKQCCKEPTTGRGNPVLMHPQRYTKGNVPNDICIRLYYDKKGIATMFFYDLVQYEMNLEDHDRVFIWRWQDGSFSLSKAAQEGKDIYGGHLLIKHNRKDKRTLLSCVIRNLPNEIHKAGFYIVMPPKFDELLKRDVCNAIQQDVYYSNDCFHKR